MKKVLILRPYSKGGVSIFYNSIEPFLTNDFVSSSCESEKDSAIGKFLKTLSNFLKLPFLVYSNKIDLVIVNPSLNKNSFIRDGIYLLISNLMRKKTVVFWRGWDRKNEYLLTKSLWSSFFNVTFRKADSTFVLDSYVEKKLCSEFNIINFKQMTTCADLKIFDKPNKIKKNKKFTILFMSRVERYKGIFELISAVSELQNSVELIIAGSGNAITEAKNYCEKERISNVTFKGFLSGHEKKEQLYSADCFILPSYSEGMPNCVLEAMACGLPIITTKVGGLNDFFVEHQMGLFIEIGNSSSILEAVNFFLLNQEKLLDISIYNEKYARNHFGADRVAVNFINAIQEL